MDDKSAKIRGNGEETGVKPMRWTAAAMKRRELRWRVSMAIILVSVGIVVAACGGSDGEEGEVAAADETTAQSSVETARQTIEEGVGEVSWTEPPGPAFDASDAEGETVWFLAIGMAVPIIQTIAANTENALSQAGVRMVICDGKFQPSEWNRCAAQAVAQRPAAIINESIPPQLISDAINRADAAGIHWIDGNNSDPADPIPAGADARAGFNYREAGRLTADWIIADSNGEANVVMIQSPDILPSTFVAGAASDEFEKNCPNCEVELREVAAADWATGLGPLTRSVLTADPSVNYLLPVFDGMTTFVVPAVNEAGAGERVKIATYNGDLDPLKTMERGEVIGADVGSHSVWLAWGYADQVLRLLNDEPPAPGENVPNRVFTEENVDELELTREAEQSGEWYGPPTFKDEYLKLWGLG